MYPDEFVTMDDVVTEPDYNDLPLLECFPELDQEDDPLPDLCEEDE